MVKQGDNYSSLIYNYNPNPSLLVDTTVVNKAYIDNKNTLQDTAINTVTTNLDTNYYTKT